MTLLGVEIPDGYFFAVVPVLMGAMFALGAWAVKKLGDHDVSIARLQEKVNDLEKGRGRR